MERPREEDEGGLEITSIGTIYSGPWDKKYWSSTRGKDKYPYPVGYQAVRTHSGITYRLEIQEGLKGPLFLISSSNGHSSSGQTPEISWDKFKRKCGSQQMVFSGKRSSRKIYGVQFFGFRSPLVQRILRELVADVNGVTEKNGLSYDICSGLAERNNVINSLQSLPKVGNQRKRSRHCNIKNTKLHMSISPDEFQTNDLFDSPVGASHWRDDKIAPNCVHSVCYATDSVHGTCSQPVDSAVLVGSIAATRENDATVPAQNPSVGYVSSSHVGHKSEESRSGVFGIGKNESIVPAEDDDQELSPVPKGVTSPVVADSCVCDLLEVMRGDMASPDSRRSQKSPHDVTENLPTVDSLEARLQPTQEIILSVSNSGSKQNDIDVACQESAKSMMLFLLPQALPLLKDSPDESKSAEPSDVLFCGVNSVDNNDVDHFKKYQPLLRSHGFGEKETSDKPSSEYFAMPLDSLHVKYVVPDSFEGEECGDDENNVKCLTPTDPESKELTDVGMNKMLDNSVTAFSNPHILHDNGISHCGEPPSGSSELHSSTFGPLCPREKLINGVYLEADVDSKLMHLEACAEEYLFDHRDGKYEHIDKMQYDQNPSESIMLVAQKPGACVQISGVPNGKDRASISRLVYQENARRDHGLWNTIHLLGCYVHPIPVSSVLLISRPNEIHVCVLCGHFTSRDRILFLYKLSIQEPIAGNPCFLACVQILLPLFEDSFGPRIATEGSCLQFTPEGQSLAMITSIKAPLCREQALRCQWSVCATDCYEGNGVVIVEVKSGYFSVVAKLETVNKVCCILVSGNNYIVAAEDECLHIWLMNATWSAPIEEFVLSTMDIFSGCILMLKKIPLCDSVILGYNGFAEFGLWDIERRILVSKFTAEGVSVVDCVPFSLYSSGTEGSTSKSTDIEDNMRRTLAETNKHTSGEGIISEALAVWLVISSRSYFDPQHSHRWRHNRERPGKEWRLALLAKNTMILGSPLDERATVFGAIFNYGIFGRCDGLVYLWELSTGCNLGILHSFKGDDVSCVAVENSCLVVVAVASGGQLLVYLLPQQELPKNLL